MDLPLGMHLFEITEENFICSQCGELTLIINRSCKTGFHCSDCHCFNRRCNYYAHKERDIKRNIKYNKDNPIKVFQFQKNYRKKHKLKCNNKSASYIRKKRKNDINYRLSDRLRARLRSALKRNSKKGSAIKDLGCSISEFKIYLQSKFQEGMTWENCGDWHIDHIIPLASFDLTIRNQLIKACHYTNLQPLWAIDNIRKKNH